MYNIASEEVFQDGQVIFKDGSSGDWVYVILSGSVEIFKVIKGKRIVIEVLGEGEVFGELGFLGGIKRTASARAVGETALGVIDRTFMDREFNKLSGDFRSIITAVVGRFKKMLERADSFSSRRDPRVQKALSLTFKDRQSFINAYTSNISNGGLFIKTKNPFNQGENFLLKLQLPGLKGPMRIKCEVVWARAGKEDKMGNPPGMGIKFVGMGKEERQIIAQYIEKASRTQE